MVSRVVITGLGCVTPIGSNVKGFWANLCAGVSGVDIYDGAPPMHKVDQSVHLAAQVKDFDVTEHVTRQQARRMDPFTAFAVASSAQAIEDAGLSPSFALSERVGVVINTGGGGTTTFAEQVARYVDRGLSTVSPFTIPMVTANRAACEVATQFGIGGPVLTSVSACASGVQAVVDGCRMIKAGEVDIVLAGASESMLGLALLAFSRTGALTNDVSSPRMACKPFDKNRRGCVIGEGAAVFVLESEESARDRGAKTYSRVLGGAMRCDAYDAVAPAPDGRGAVAAMSSSLAVCDVRPADIGYICAHGTGTVLNDKIETAAIKTVLGDAAYTTPISSPKSMVGHLFGAAGAISVLASCLAIRDGIIPPTINLLEPDPLCDLDYVPNRMRRTAVRIAMVNAFGFGGQNCVALLGAPE